jgi:hypothetical protein
MCRPYVPTGVVETKTMAQNPVNHPLRPLYRVFGGLTGLYVLAFGAVGVFQSSGEMFGRSDATALGLRTNLGFSILSIIIAALLLVATGIGGNLNCQVNTVAGYGFIVAGLASLAVLRTDANYFNFTVSTCVVSFLLGCVLLMAGMYGKVGTVEEARLARESNLLL